MKRLRLGAERPTFFLTICKFFGGNGINFQKVSYICTIIVRPEVAKAVGGLICTATRTKALPVEGWVDAQAA